MSWKPKYAENRRRKYSSNPEERERRKSQGRTPEENREYMRKYYEENREKFKEDQVRRRANPGKRERRNQLRRERYARDAEYRQKCRDSAKDNPAAKREAKLRRQYGISSAEFNEMMDRQGERCAICRSTAADSKSNYLHVDHCHTSGSVRGLLCGPCNRGIGLLQDDPELLRNAIEYLTAFRSLDEETK